MAITMTRKIHANKPGEEYSSRFKSGSCGYEIYEVDLQREGHFMRCRTRTVELKESKPKFYVHRATNIFVATDKRWEGCGPSLDLTTRRQSRCVSTCIL